MGKNKNNQIYSGAPPDQVEADLKELVDFQEEGISMENLSRMIENRLLPHMVRYDRKEFQSLYNFFPEKGAKFGASIALKYNQGVTNWQVSPGGVMLEELCCQSLCQLFGFLPDSDATFMYCGTYANQQALYMALHRKAEQEGFNFAEKGLMGFREPERLVAVTSSQAHFSLHHAIRSIGLGEQNMVTLPVDANYRIDVNKMREIVGELRKTKDIFCLVPTAGTTSTGSIDPILPCVNLCKELNIWLHVDGAYGLAFSLIPRYKPLFKGINYADSVSWDPHKQFGVPIPSSLLFVRNKSEFDRVAIFGKYFNRKEDPEPNPGLKSLPSTRPFSALPLVTSIRYQGLKKVIKRLNAPLQAIQTLAKNLKNESLIDVCHQPDTGILCIRVIPGRLPEKQLDKLQQHVFQQIKTEGKRSISITELNNKTVLRLVAISPSVTCESLMETVTHIKKLAEKFQKETFNT